MTTGNPSDSTKTTTEKPREDASKDLAKEARQRITEVFHNLEDVDIETYILTALDEREPDKRAAEDYWRSACHWKEKADRCRQALEKIEHETDQDHIALIAREALSNDDS